MMMNLGTQSTLTFGATLLLVLGASACGGKTNDVGANGASGTDGSYAGFGAASGTGGVGSVGTGSAGTGVNGGGAGTSAAGTGAGGTGTGGTGGFMMAMCDPNAPTTATCGGTACPAPGGFAQFTCTVPCCTTANECGTQTARMGMAPSACMVGNGMNNGMQAVEDPSCPGYQGMTQMGMAVDLPGCCTTDGVCGAISDRSGTCITSSRRYTDLAPGGPCNNDADAGM